MDSKIRSILSETLTLTTAAPTQAAVAPAGATGIEISGTGGSTPTFNFTPALASALLFDNSASTYTDYTDALRQRGATNVAVLDLFEGAADYLYIGCAVPFRALYVAVSAANATASVSAVEYWNGTAWTDIVDTDNTASGGATLALSDTITWTTPTAWVPTTVSTVGPSLYWVRWQAATTLDSEVELSTVVPLDVHTAQPLTTVQTATATSAILPRYWFAAGDVGGVEVTGDNTDTAIINWLITNKRTIFVAGS